MEQLIGQTLDRYQLLALLGQGGMGAVFRARDLGLKREVAVKVLHAHLATQSVFKERFLREAQIAAQLDHPGIMKVYDFGQSDNLLYIVMEFIVGENLAQMLESLRTEKRWVLLPEAIEVVRQVAMALDYAHQRHVLHRDIKPANIMLKRTPSGVLPYQPIITDLGLAKLGEEAGFTQTGVSMGTPAYMSPEQALGEPTDARSDVYSLGVLLYELALGQRPFPATTLSAAIRYHTREAPPPPKSIRPDVPEPLAQIILRTLAKERSQRFASAQALADALAALPQATIINTVPPAATAGSSTLVTKLQQSLVEMRGPSLLGDFPDAGPGPLRVQILMPQGNARTVTITEAISTVGRTSENQIVIADEKASRQHLRIERSGDLIRVTDLGSTNGTYLGPTKLLAGVPEVWRPELPIRIGSHYLRLAPAAIPSDSGTIPEVRSDPENGPTGTVDISLPQETIVVEPGQAVSLRLILLNQGALVDHFAIALTGLPSAWVQTPHLVQLMPGMQQEVTLSIQPPRTSQSKAGDYPVTVQVAGQDNPTQAATRKLTLQVQPFTDSRSELQPQEGQAGRPMRVAIQNQGNILQHYTVNGQDRADELRFEPPTATVQAAPGEAATVEFRPRLRRRRWFGAAKQHAIAVKIVPDQGQPAGELPGSVVSRGVIPTWVPLALVALLLAMCGLITNQSNELERQNEAATATAIALAHAVDSDGDGLTDVEEAKLGTDPTLADTDQDGLTDKEEIDFGSKPTMADTDGDALLDGDERKWGTDPNVVDTDKDGWADGKEVNETHTHPALDDTDRDNILDPNDPDPGHPPTPTPLPTSTPNLAATQAAAAALTAEAGCTVNTDNLNLRSGPGTIYEPPLSKLPNGTKVTVLGFNNAGIPDGEWVLVKARPGGAEGWLNRQYLDCNVNIASFPVVPPPATPTPISTDTPIPTDTPTPTDPVFPMCTPPPCADGGSLVCESGDCPGGCGVVCVTSEPPPTDPPTATLWPVSETGVEACHLLVSEWTIIRENAVLWAEPDVTNLDLLINRNLEPGSNAQVLDGPLWRKIRRDIDYDGWWFRIRIESSGQDGWIWEARLEGCQRPEDYVAN